MRENEFRKEKWPQNKGATEMNFKGNDEWKLNSERKNGHRIKGPQK